MSDTDTVLHMKGPRSDQAHVKEPLTALLKPNTKELSQSTAKAHIFLTLRLDPLAKTQYSRVASVTIPKSHDRCRQCPTY